MAISFRGGPNPGTGTLPYPRPSSGGLVFSEAVPLALGRHCARLQVQFSPFAQSDTVTVSAVHAGRTLARAEISASDDDALDQADRLTLEIDLPEAATVTFEGRSSANAAPTHLRFLTVLDGAPAEDRFAFYPDGVPHRDLRAVVLGTTAVCNANCSHCPTNKAYSRTQAKGVMAMDLFEKIAGELGAADYRGDIASGRGASI